MALARNKAMKLKLELNGQTVEGLVRASVVANNYFSCNSFSFMVAAGPNPLLSLDQLTALAGGYAALSAEGGGGTDREQLIYGKVDRILCDPVVGIVCAEGRDLSALMIDSYLQRDFVNQTASEIVAAIAAKHGLTAQVTPTEGWAGRYFADGYSRLSVGDFSRYRSDWDLVAELAREQNFDLYVDGSTLYFGPSIPSVSDRIELTPSDLMTLQIERNCCVADVVSVGIQTWNTQEMRAYLGGIPGAGSVSAGEAAGAPPYLFSHPNLTAAQADIRAALYAREIGRLGTVVRIQMPWDLRIRPRGLILLSGTGTSFDGTYSVDSVERSFCGSSGSTQTATAFAWAP